jgi:hypothetical protein
MIIKTKTHLDHILGEIRATEDTRQAAYLAYARGDDELLKILNLSQPEPEDEEIKEGEPCNLTEEEAAELGAEEIPQPDGATDDEVRREWLGQWGDLPGDDWKHAAD